VMIRRCRRRRLCVVTVSTHAFVVTVAGASGQPQNSAWCLLWKSGLFKLELPRNRLERRSQEYPVMAIVLVKRHNFISLHRLFNRPLVNAHCTVEEVFHRAGAGLLLEIPEIVHLLF